MLKYQLVLVIFSTHGAMESERNARQKSFLFVKNMYQNFGLKNVIMSMKRFYAK